MVVTANGTGEFFTDTGGYDFVSTDDDVDDEDVFFHTVDVGGPVLEEGREAEFDIELLLEGLRQTNLVHK